MENKTGWVYNITSPVNKKYTGSTNDIKERQGSYRNLNCKNQVKLYNSLSKYGFENHVFEIMWTGDINDMLMYECLIGTYYEVLDKK